MMLGNWYHAVEIKDDDSVEVKILKEMIVSLGLTGAQIAKDLGLSVNTIYRILRRETTRGVNVYVMAIAYYYGYKGDLRALVKKGT